MIPSGQMPTTTAPPTTAPTTTAPPTTAPTTTAPVAPTTAPVAPSVAPPPAPSNLVPVRFVARTGTDDRYRIHAAGNQCTTPCTLELSAGGVAPVAVDGGQGSYRASLAVPRLPSTVTVSHRSRAYYLVGGALLAAGIADVALGCWFALGSSFDGHEAVGGVNIALGSLGGILGIVDLALAGRARLETHAEARAAIDALDRSAR